ncbi:mannosyl-3-phosphoglycerate phosphatase [Salmonella enterica subsp. enterica]|uniref:Mannosyl-3-phosphoglycerate phosphatase n=1 Tax=Salmonella enterica I TaxID=59201 RepID=A0A3S4LUX6_SALET|nr:mannosyl-3-phosphoglycerate phosphatase [Salmonella enterica subsp. enterica]
MLSIHDPLLIFTDLDGTLLNSHTFEWQPAAPWLTRLHESGVPVILCSSKTAAEMLQLQTTLNLQGLPLIAENGAVLQLDVHLGRPSQLSPPDSRYFSQRNPPRPA